MRLIIDQEITKALECPDTVLKKISLLPPDSRLSLRWPTFLEFIGLGSHLSSCPAFDETNPFFVATVATLSDNDEREVCLYVYDRLFTECLNQIRELSHINATDLLEAIKAKRLTPNYLSLKQIIEPSLDAYESAFKDFPAQTLHDLILYLAWDRMCMCTGRLFDYQSSNPNYIKNLELLKSCLCESYQHIKNQGRTSPSIYMMFVSIYFYQMREENLQKHSDVEWEILNKSAQILTAHEPVFYIDDAVSEHHTETERDSSEVYLSSENTNTIKIRMDFAQYMIDKLRSEIPDWNYHLVKNMKTLSVNL